jgi:hypothetical protein
VTLRPVGRPDEFLHGKRQMRKLYAQLHLANSLSRRMSLPNAENDTS